MNWFTVPRLFAQKSRIKLILFSLGLALAAAAEIASANDTPDYYRCRNRVGGEWNFGRAPSGCDAATYGADTVVTRDFADYIFNDQNSVETERGRYMTALNAVVREAAVYYIKKRNPKVADDELQAWLKLVRTTAANESFWSHYRQAGDQAIKMMRGDVGHGHGLMQIDDRAHFNVVEQGIAWNLVSNLTYAMDILYDSWIRAPGQACVGGATKYTERIRATWAAYNGGPLRLCRWTNPNDRFSQNDRNFLYHLNTQDWAPFVADPSLAASVDVPCLIEKRENCAPNSGPSPTTLRPGFLYSVDAKHYCVLNNSSLKCVDQFRDAICLLALDRYTGSPVALDSSSVALPRESLDRHQICKDYQPDLIGVGEILLPQLSINLRATPGGGLLGQVDAGEPLQVMDFELRTPPTNYRYYKVRKNGVEGYIFGGTSQTQSQWVVSTPNVPAIASNVARPGERVRISAPNGINLRATPGGTWLGLAPNGATFTVLATRVEGSDNNIYYQIKLGELQGFVYSGALLPANSVASWTKLLNVSEP